MATIKQKFYWSYKYEPNGDLSRYNVVSEEYDYTLCKDFDSEEDAVAAYQTFVDVFGAYEYDELTLNIKYVCVG